MQAPRQGLRQSGNCASMSSTSRTWSATCTGRTRELWAQTLREPMPFGGPPIGMPRVEVKR